MTTNESIEYLNKVLNQWEEFCKSHKPFKRAIQNVLIRNYMLESENEELRKQIKDFESRVHNVG